MVEVPQKLQGLDFIKIVSIHNKKYMGIKTTSGLTTEKMKRFAKAKVNRKKRSIMSKGFGYLVAIDGTSDEPTTIGVTKSRVSAEKYTLVSREFTSSMELELA